MVGSPCTYFRLASALHRVKRSQPLEPLLLHTSRLQLLELQWEPVQHIWVSTYKGGHGCLCLPQLHLLGKRCVGAWASSTIATALDRRDTLQRKHRFMTTQSLCRLAWCSRALRTRRSQGSACTLHAWTSQHGRGNGRRCIGMRCRFDVP